MKLIVNPASKEEEIYDLKPGTVTIGRARENGIVILDTSLSRHHAQLEIAEDRVVLTDLQSTNGTTVNGVKIDHSRLSPGDMIQCGDIRLYYAPEHTIVKEIPTDLSRITMRDLLVQQRETEPLSVLRLKQQSTGQRPKDQLKVLLKVSEMLSRPGVIDVLLRKILDLLFQIMDVERAAILLRNEQTGEVEAKVAKSAAGAESVSQTYSRHIVNYALEKSVAVISTDASADPRFEESASICRQSIRSTICLPLQVHNQSIGVLYVDNLSAPDRFGQEELEFLSGFANQAAIAIENAKLYEKIEEEAKAREKELVRMVEERTKDLAEAKAAAEEANRAKSKFLASMSHELRTPLNAVIGYSEMLQEEATDLGQESLIPDLKKIHAAGNHLLALINDILDLSKIEAGKMELYLETFELPTLVEGIATTIKPLILKNFNKLSLEYPENIGTMYADATKIRQVLFNLLSNAGKFTKEGTITLELERNSAASGDSIFFRVKDTGIGMTPEQLGKLFQTFQQADASISKKYGGTGLGLALSRRFCQMMGGDITVESEYGKGTVFTAQLPAEVPDPRLGGPASLPAN